METFVSSPLVAACRGGGWPTIVTRSCSP